MPTENSLPLVADPITIDRLDYLRRERRIISKEIREIVATVQGDTLATVACLHCAYQWTPYNQLALPKTCPRCGTRKWNREPGPMDRTPGDPPAPSWRAERKGNRRPKVRVMGKKWKRRTATEMEDAREQAAPSMLAIPPRLAALLPPPPDPASLSLRSRAPWMQTMVEPEMEEQPERVASMRTPPPPPPPPDPLPPPQEIIEQGTDVEREDAVEVSIALAQPSPEPEYRENTLTERELNELSEAEEVIWPTTTADD